MCSVYLLSRMVCVGQNRKSKSDWDNKIKRFSVSTKGMVLSWMLMINILLQL